MFCEYVSLSIFFSKWINNNFSVCAIWLELEKQYLWITEQINNTFLSAMAKKTEQTDKQ